ncbi:hypothetical protein DM02DRAFT_651488 [Periconia macrospinosa]|uniref:Uncharacterized protein n=1 Tax=Periconia macrospinosa TaxID=97972 RepID=A0A2V1E287_9PLEO|nr:hypothetical protein DM02DRAFT_651488 [Periconia macrospinosa]
MPLQKPFALSPASAQPVSQSEVCRCDSVTATIGESPPVWQYFHQLLPYMHSPALSYPIQDLQSEPTWCLVAWRAPPYYCCQQCPYRVEKTAALALAGSRVWFSSRVPVPRSTLQKPLQNMAGNSSESVGAVPLPSLLEPLQHAISQSMMGKPCSRSGRDPASIKRASPWHTVMPPALPQKSGQSGIDWDHGRPNARGASRHGMACEQPSI